MGTASKPGFCFTESNWHEENGNSIIHRHQKWLMMLELINEPEPIFTYRLSSWLSTIYTQSSFQCPGYNVQLHLMEGHRWSEWEWSHNFIAIIPILTLTRSGSTYDPKKRFEVILKWLIKKYNEIKIIKNNLIHWIAQSAWTAKYTTSLQRGKPCNEFPGTALNNLDVEVPVKLEFWGMWSTYLLPSFPGPF